MKKVIVIGCPGSGKSTFAKTLHKETGIPLYHLDMLKWNADKTTVSREVFTERLDSVLSQDEWIIDGNYASTMEKRINACDTVFFLDFTTEVCVDGVKSRKGKIRTDIPFVETEDDEELLEFIRKYNKESRPKVIELLNKHPKEKLVVFKNRKEMDDYLKALILGHIDVSFSYLLKTDFEAVALDLFNILADNMEIIAPTGSSREEDYKCWFSAVSEGLQRSERQIILIKENQHIIGFFQYYVNSDTFMMEEIQIKSAYHGKNIFRDMCGFISSNIGEDIEFVKAYANITNHKSIGILEKLGLSKIGTNKNGRGYYFKGNYSDLLKWYNREV